MNAGIDIKVITGDLKETTLNVLKTLGIELPENKIMSARRFYNNNVKTFNTKQEVIPSSIIAKFFKFKKAQLFEITDLTEREVPKADFSNN